MLLFSSVTPWCVAEARAAVEAAAERVPQTANVLQLPDDATTLEVQGEYGAGIAILLFGVLLTSGVLYGLFVVLLQRTWGEHDHAHIDGRPPH